MLKSVEIIRSSARQGRSQAHKWALHARPWVCHASITFQRDGSSTQHGCGTPDPGHATLVQFSRGKKEMEKTWACHLGSKVWHARLHKWLKRPWACHVRSKAWHARDVSEGGRATCRAGRGTPSQNQRKAGHATKAPAAR
ncbi:hypothetical protein AHAS_Ahas05G0166600 [Arachis hypogaea]